MFYQHHTLVEDFGLLVHELLVKGAERFRILQYSHQEWFAEQLFDEGVDLVSGDELSPLNMVSGE